MVPTPVEQFELPPPPQVPPRPAIPVVAAIAPAVAAGALWLVTGSAYVLLFAALGPVMAGASLADGLLRRRRSRRTEHARYAAALDELEHRIAAGHERARAAAVATLPRPEDAIGAQAVAEAWVAGAVPVAPVRIGVAEQRIDARLAGADPEDPAFAARVAELREAARSRADAPLGVDAAAGIGIVGPTAATRALARAIALDVLAARSPRHTVLRAPSDEAEWTRLLPHRVDEGRPGAFEIFADAPDGDGPDGCVPLRVAWSRTPGGLGTGCGVVLRVAGEGPATLLRSAQGPVIRRWRPRLVAIPAARRAAAHLTAVATAHGIASGSALLPDEVRLDELGGTPAPGGLAVPLGLGTAGPVLVDLVHDGPHALVAGTTGSGKSELLVSWVLALAERHPPDRLAFLLVDFKGGASFSGLARLPHVVATLSDLDASRAHRAMASLRAELRRRERVIADHAARAIDDLPPGMLARLVVVVDEYAAVVAEHPGLHEVFADLAARGRSLGLHLVLCTQRPAGVVRDAALANINLRIALRVADRADSLAVLSSDAAARLAPRPRGRAIVSDGGSEPRTMQVAISSPDHAESIAARTPGIGRAPQPWCDPLPAVIPIADADRMLGPWADDHGGILLGIADVPAEQRRAPVRHDFVRDGHLLVLGGPRSGRTTALATVARAAEDRAIVVPPDPADAWAVIDSVLETKVRDAVVLVIDDVDVLLDRAGPEYAVELADRLVRLARESSRRRLALAMSAARPGGAVHPLAALAPTRLLLRQTDREAHLLAGGEVGDYEPESPPGAGRWRGLSVQLVLPPEPADGLLARAAQRHAPVVPRIGAAPSRPLAIATTRARRLAALWRDAGADVVELAGVSPLDAAELRVAGKARVLVGDPDAWQSSWSLLAAARRELPFVVEGVGPAEVRALTRLRDVPPLGATADECWLAEDGRVHRAVLDLP